MSFLPRFWGVIGGLFVGTAILFGFLAWHFAASDSTSVHTSDDSTEPELAVPVDREEASFSETEVGFEEVSPEVAIGFENRYQYSELQNWQRPTGPITVALQVGHLQNDEVPEELSGLTRNGAGATWGPYQERDQVEIIASETAALLEAQGLTVDLLPATVPSGYYADVFVSIHADGNRNETVRGYKTAHFSHDFSGLSALLEAEVNEAYGNETGLPKDESITYYMTGYYAFNWWRYEHAVHPMTPAVIIETGFITNANDREVIVENPQTAANGIAKGILAFLEKDYSNEAVTPSVTFPPMPLTGTYQCLEAREDVNPRRERSTLCRPGLVREDGRRYGLMFVGAATSSVLSNVASGSLITVEGQFQPMVAVRNLSWYDYRVRGVIYVTSLQIQTSTPN